MLGARPSGYQRPPLIRETLALGRGELQKHHISVQAAPNEQLPRVRAVPVQVQQVLLNLFTNAIESTVAKGGTWILRVNSEVHQPGSVMVSVEDTGAGIGRQDGGRKFNPLFTTKSHGMGMGLPICRSIIEAHDGRLWAVPNTPEGAVFQFVLPAR
jgi:signal transduction histidine kinase